MIPQPVSRRRILPVFLGWFLAVLLMDAGSLQARDTGVTENRSGPYIEIGGQTDPTAVGVGLGAFQYNYPYLSTRLALYVLNAESVDDTFFGADAGVRLEPGTRIAPFVGVGGYYGYHSDQIPAEDDSLDNDGDGRVDEDGEKQLHIDRSMATIYPEAGIHIWIDKVNRLTLSGKYHVTTEGRDTDFWLFCFGIYFAFP